MWESMSLDNLYTLKELVIKYIEILFTTKWDIKDFIKSTVWNPNKQNIKNLTFMARMKQETKYIPGIGNRFEYAIVKKYPYTYDIKGRQKKLSVGDKMEYIKTIIEDQLEIDLSYYFGNEVTGQFARLITYDTSYEVYNGEEVDDKATYDNCKKIIKVFADKYINEYTNVGGIYKKLYRNVKNQMNNVTINPRMKCITINNADSFEQFIINIKDNVNKQNNSNMANKIVKKNINLQSMYQMFSNKKNKESYYTLTINALNQTLDTTIDELYNLMNSKKLLEKIISYNDKNVSNVIKYIKTQYNFDNQCIDKCNDIKEVSEIINDSEINEIVKKEELYETIEPELLNQVFNYMVKIAGTYRLILLNEQIRDILTSKKNRNVGIITKPLNFKR